MLIESYFRDIPRKDHLSRPPRNPKVAPSWYLELTLAREIFRIGAFCLRMISVQSLPRHRFDLTKILEGWSRLGGEYLAQCAETIV